MKAPTDFQILLFLVTVSLGECAFVAGVYAIVRLLP